MRTDIWTHLLSPAYVEYLEREGGQGRAAFLLAQRAMRDVQFRLRVIDDHVDYRQVLTPCRPFSCSTATRCRRRGRLLDW